MKAIFFRAAVIQKSNNGVQSPGASPESEPFAPFVEFFPAGEYDNTATPSSLFLTSAATKIGRPEKLKEQFPHFNGVNPGWISEIVWDFTNKHWKACRCACTASSVRRKKWLN